ncbi:glycosyltransferase family 2 protein [Aquipuribacter sp. MA13-6]|uniref:glycosyltransferase family 2 protein n=1 Tax=unclassified Aquipuribacter TaxID=2635084 RepID=UPI003EE93945
MSTLTAAARHPDAPAQAPVRTVGVVVASYNYGRFLGECVRSLLVQPGVDVRVLVMDDASTDDTPTVSQALSRLDGRVEPVRNEVNLGHIATFNRGFRLMEERHQPDYVVKLDADDAVADGALARAVALMEAERSVSFVYGRPRRVVGDHLDTRSARPVLDRPRHARTVWPGQAWLAQRCRTGIGCISNPEVVMRGAAFRRLGGQMDERLSHTYDFELWLRLAAVGDVGHVDDHYQGVYRIHGDSMMRTVNAGPVVDLRGRLEAFASLGSPLFDHVRGRDGLHTAARRRVAEQAVDAACRAYERGRGGEAPVAELLAIADDGWPGWRDSSVGRRWSRRERLGPRRTPFSPLAARVLPRRVSEEVTRLRWQRWGV